MRNNRGQEFVIGGCTIARRPFGALTFLYCEGRLASVARIRNGFTPAVRQHGSRSSAGSVIDNRLHDCLRGSERTLDEPLIIRVGLATYVDVLYFWSIVQAKCL